MGVGIVGAIIALLQALPEIIRIVGKLVDMIGKNQLKGFLSDCEVMIDQLKAAKTPEEKQNAARGMSDLISKLG